MTGVARAGHIFAALDLANLFRRAIGVPELSLLPVADSQPQEPHECVLARAFNAGCEIDYDHSGDLGYPSWSVGDPEDEFEFHRGGAVRFGADFGERTAEALARQFGEESGVEPYKDDKGRWLCPLRDEITAIAVAFDGHELHTLITEEERALIDLEEEEIENV